ncbi:hypothetical protein [Streptomyces sp. NPDC050145]|uniref:hypothetical protein n=1 Tax=Streptomyces sp. NPDC050145 TaxID=3365602 RepID=UPI003789161A
MTEDPLHFFAEVRVVDSPNRPDLVGRAGAILGISEPRDSATPVEYSVMIDGYERLVAFRREAIAPTGRDRSREDYY